MPGTYISPAETCLYYLQSRYYNPGTGRFINADALVSTGQGLLGNNMFAYCINNPLLLVDTSGYSGVCFAVNLDSEGRRYITDQNDIAIQDKRFGLATISHSGCGVVASYNALITLGNGKDFDEVLAYYNSKILSTFGFGLSGLLPYDIAEYFESMGYLAVITDDNDIINALSKNADACIMFYVFPNTYRVGGISIAAFGAHFVEYSPQKNGYIGRNTSEGNGVYYFSDPAAYGQKGNRYYVAGIFIYK